MGTILKKVYFRTLNDMTRYLPGYFIKWTKMGVMKTADGKSVINTEIEVAVIAAAEDENTIDVKKGETFLIKIGDFKLDLPSFISENKIESF